jgi:hypothetical protein
MAEKFNHQIPQASLEKLIPIVNSVTHHTPEDLAIALTQLKKLDDRQFIGGEVQKKAFTQKIEDQLKKKINFN